MSIIPEDIKVKIQDVLIEFQNEFVEMGSLYSDNILLLSKEHPTDSEYYLRTTIFNLKEHINSNSTLGHVWINSGCPSMYDIVDNLVERIHLELINTMKYHDNAYENGYIPHKRTVDEILGMMSFVDIKLFMEYFNKIYFIEELLNKKLTQISDVDSLKASLLSYGFFELQKIQGIKKQDSVVDLLYAKGGPYKIAFFEYVGFIDHLRVEYADYKVGARDKLLSKILNINADTVKKNILSLTGSHRVKFLERYTAHTYKEMVIIDYKSLL
jgi:hypothetical protein